MIIIAIIKIQTRDADEEHERNCILFIPSMFAPVANTSFLGITHVCVAAPAPAPPAAGRSHFELPNLANSEAKPLIEHSQDYFIHDHLLHLQNSGKRAIHIYVLISLMVILTYLPI
jgi:hypothetical protein